MQTRSFVLNNQLLASDNFASGSLAAGWGTWPTLAQCAITGTPPFYAEPVAAGATSYGQLWTGLTWPADQISEITIQTAGAGTNTYSLGVRYTASNNGYQAIFNTGSNILQVYKVVSGALTQLGSNTGISATSSGDVISFSAIGAVIAFYKNGKRIFYIGDTTFPSGGSPGFFLGANTAVANAQVSSWRGYSGVQQDGIWQKQGCVFAPTAGEVALGGSLGTGVTPLQGVIFDSNPQILTQFSKVYKCWFTSGATGLVGVGYAESPDGITWTRYSSNPVIPLYVNGAVFKSGGTYYHWGQSSSQIGNGSPFMHTSLDGINWTAAVATDLSGISACYYNLSVVDFIAGTFYVLFGALNGVGGAANTYAASSTNGINWTVLNSGNPVISNFFMGGTSVKVGNTYYAWCNSNQPGQGNGNFDPLENVLYKSTDRVNWTFVRHSLHAWGAWESLNSNAAGVYAVSVLQVGNRVGMFYIGSPADNAAPQVYQGGLALAGINSTLAQIVAVNVNEDATVQVASDAFPGNSLSANWTIPPQSSAMSVSGGHASASTSAAACWAVRTGETYSGSQYSEITISTLGGISGTINCTPLVLASPTAKTFYQAEWTGPTGSTNSIPGIFKQIAGVQTLLGQIGNTVTPQPGDVIRLTVTLGGSDGFPVLTLSQNGFTILQVQDTTATPLTSGSPGMFINTNGSSVANAAISLWAGGNANVLPTFSASSAALWLMDQNTDIDIVKRRRGF